MKVGSTPERDTSASAKARQLELPRFLPYRLSVVTEQVSKLVTRAYAARFGISIPEWRVIAHLGRSSGLGAKTIGEQTAMDKVKVSRAVARLTERRFIRREVNPLDQRAVLLALTSAGRAIYDSVAPAALNIERDIFAEFEPAEVAQFARMLDRIEARVAHLTVAENETPRTKRRRTTA
jgi:DNA-binding MarR family transcriptional regulator